MRLPKPRRKSAKTTRPPATACTAAPGAVLMKIPFQLGPSARFIPYRAVIVPATGIFSFPRILPKALAVSGRYGASVTVSVSSRETGRDLRVCFDCFVCFLAFLAASRRSASLSSGPPPIFLKTVQTIRTVSTAGAYRRAAACSCPAAAQRAGGSSALAACTTAGTA